VQTCIYKWQAENNVLIIALATIHLYFVTEINWRKQPNLPNGDRRKILSRSLSDAHSAVGSRATSQTRARARSALLLAGGQAH
jgi:hypothetical protein